MLSTMEYILVNSLFCFLKKNDAPVKELLFFKVLLPVAYMILSL